MTRRHLFHPVSFYQGLSALLILFLLITGCATVSTEVGKPVKPPTPIRPEAVRSLEKAQNLFNEAVRSDQPTVDVPAAALQKYQKVVNQVEKDVLGKVDKPLKMNAYALLAFSQWRLGNYEKAMKAGDKGSRLYDETQKLSTNRRDYGMCLMVGGLCLASQTYKEYKDRQGPTTKALAQKLTGQLEQARRAIDSGSTQMDRREDIAVYANLWQLALVDNAVRIWTTGLTREVWQPEVCRWLDRAKPVFAKFPDTAYPWQNRTVTYKNKFEQLKKKYCQGQ